jgi:endogenous inhibitor of DNA gyrase (YacG/DUF329 family)
MPYASCVWFVRFDASSKPEQPNFCIIRASIQQFSPLAVYVTLGREMLVKCPKCGKEAEYNGNEFRPFCSERCKLIDFGAWVDEEYALPAEDTELTDEHIDEIENALGHKP